MSFIDTARIVHSPRRCRRGHSPFPAARRGRKIVTGGHQYTQPILASTVWLWSYSVARSRHNFQADAVNKKIALKWTSSLEPSISLIYRRHHCGSLVPLKPSSSFDWQD